MALGGLNCIGFQFPDVLRATPRFVPLGDKRRELKVLLRPARASRMVSGPKTRTNTVGEGGQIVERGQRISPQSRLDIHRSLRLGSLYDIY
jgi:hypothetical protein